MFADGARRIGGRPGRCHAFGQRDGGRQARQRRRPRLVRTLPLVRTGPIVSEVAYAVGIFAAVVLGAALVVRRIARRSQRQPLVFFEIIAVFVRLFLLKRSKKIFT